MKNRISILATLLLTFCVNVVTAQLYEISLDQKLQNSTLIIEGKVVKSEAFRGYDGHIYTAHDIQAFSILKGGLQDLQDQKITVITYGGTLDEEVETWTHLLTLSKNDVGVFFLTATNRPVPHANKVFYEVYSSSQGFLKYTENDFQEVVAIAPFNYHQKNDLLQNIRQSTGQFTPVFTDNDGSPEDVTGVEYSIQNISLSGNVLDFDIYVEGLWGSYDLTESELLIEYDPTILGQNVQTNGVLSISPGVVSSSPNYTHLTWFPVDTNSVIEFAYTVHQFDSTISHTQKVKTDFDFKLFPQPASNYTTIQINTDYSKTVAIELYDITGRRLKSIYNGKLNPNQNEFILDTSALPNAMYIVTIKSQDFIQSKKLIIQK